MVLSEAIHININRKKHKPDTAMLSCRSSRRIDSRQDDDRSRRVPTAPLSTHSAEAKMPRPARSACHDLYKIYQVLSLHIPQWSSNDALIVWRSVSGRFLGPIT